MVLIITKENNMFWERIAGGHRRLSDLTQLMVPTVVVGWLNELLDFSSHKWNLVAMTLLPATVGTKADAFPELRDFWCSDIS
jgi:hypothetical protein